MSKCTGCKMEINYEATICPYCNTSWGGHPISAINVINKSNAFVAWVKFIWWGFSTKYGLLFFALPTISYFVLALYFDSFWWGLLVFAIGLFLSFWKAPADVKRVLKF